MKAVFLIALTFFSTGFIYAQTSEDVMVLAHRQDVRSLLEHQRGENVPKPTGAKQRLIAQSRISDIFNDSATYHYSGTRGSKFGFDLFRFNFFLTESHDPQGLSTYTLADSIVAYDDGVYQSTDYGYYRQDSKIDSIAVHYNSAIFNLDRAKISYSYLGQQFPAARYSQQYSSGSPADTYSIVTYFYDNNRLVKDSSFLKQGGIWLKEGMTEYVYNAVGKLQQKRSFSFNTPGSELISESNYSYLPDQKLHQVYTLKFVMGISTDTLIDSIAYTPGIEYPTYWKLRRHRNSSSIYQSSSIEIWYPGIAGTPDSAFTSIGFSNGSEIEATYRLSINTFGNPERILKFDEGNTTSVANIATNFYYEIYDDGLSIKDVANGLNVSAYPNPFDQYLSLTCKVTLVGRYRVRLVNALGVEVFSTHLSLNAGITRIDLPDLAVGFYHLIMQNEKGETVTKKLVRNKY